MSERRRCLSVLWWLVAKVLATRVQLAAVDKVRRQTHIPAKTWISLWGIDRACEDEPHKQHKARLNEESCLMLQLRQWHLHGPSLLRI